jgi:hypothetical protein
MARIGEALSRSPFGLVPQTGQNSVEDDDPSSPDSTEPEFGVSPMSGVISDPDG